MSDLAYPHDLARLILGRWKRVHAGQDKVGIPDPWDDETPPSPEALERLIIICYQSSLLREEARPVTFRVILAEPGRFPCDQGPPDGLHCLRFLHNRPFNPLEARRLSPAANFYRSLIGVCLDERRNAADVGNSAFGHALAAKRPWWPRPGADAAAGIGIECHRAG